MMANIFEDIQCVGSDTRPPMLDRSDFESWQQRIRLYCLGKENGENILKSIDEGPFKMGRFRETLVEGAKGVLHLGPERDRVFTDLTPEENERYKADIRATNILLQGLPKDIYTLINHYTYAKDIWDNVKMLLEGFELTKDERESQLYDDFEHFCQNKGETIHEYYVRFTKLINNMRNIKMTMPKMQLNSKFVNNMLPEWGRLATAVKLNRGLKTSNYDQLYAYLKQHEAHANENKMMLERYNQHAIDHLAFVSNVSPQQYPTQSSSISQSAYVPSGRQNRDQGNYARGAVIAGNGGVQNRVGNSNLEYFKDKMLLMQAQENRVVLDEEQLLFIAGGQTNTFDDDVDEAPVQDLALNEDNTMFMANLSSADPIYDEAGPSYDSDILSEVQDHDNYLDSVGEYHEVHEMQNDVQPNYVVNSDAEYTSDSNIILYEQYVKDNTVQVVQSNVSCVPNDDLMMIINDMLEQAAQCVSTHEQNKIVNESLTAELVRYKEQFELYEKRARPNHAPAVVHDSEDTLELAEITRKRMLEKVKSPMCVEKKLKHFEGIQKALIKEVKEIKEIFKQMEAEVEQNVVDKQCADIERKNLLIENKNLIAGCLSHELLYSVMNDHLKESFRNNKSKTSLDALELDTVFEINRMKESLQGKDNTIRKLKAQISQLNKRRSEADRILDFKTLDFQNTELTEKATALQEQNELFRAENAKIKQHYKELYSMKITRTKTIEKTTSLNNREVHLDYLKHLKKSVETLREIVEEARIEKPLDNALDKRDKKVATTPLNRNKQVAFKETCETSKTNTQTHVKQQKVHKTNVLVIPSTGVNSSTEASSLYMPPVKNVSSKVKQFWKATGKLFANVGYQWKPTGRKITLGEQCPLTRFTKSKVVPLTKPEHVSSSKIVITERFNNITQSPLTRYKRRNKQGKAISTGTPTTAETQLIDDSVHYITVVHIVIWYLDLGCSKHMTGNRSRLKNFIKKFIGAVRFGNNHFGAIMGYGDYGIGDSVISRVYYVEGLGHNLFSVGQFYDSDLEVTFRKHSCYVRYVHGVELLKGSRGSNMYTIYVEDI
ncbi:hypothetical protein Tco_1465055 [Tanacetum coccineum]